MFLAVAFFSFIGIAQASDCSSLSGSYSCSYGIEIDLDYSTGGDGIPRFRVLDVTSGKSFVYEIDDLQSESIEKAKVYYCYIDGGFRMIGKVKNSVDSYYVVDHTLWGKDMIINSYITSLPEGSSLSEIKKSRSINYLNCKKLN